VNLPPPAPSFVQTARFLEGATSNPNGSLYRTSTISDGTDNREPNLSLALTPEPDGGISISTWKVCWLSDNTRPPTLVALVEPRIEEKLCRVIRWPYALFRKGDDLNVWKASATANKEMRVTRSEAVILMLIFKLCEVSLIKLYEKMKKKRSYRRTE
jgi:hypothetical protein